METNKKKFTVNILGVDYNIITDDDELRVRAVAAFVDKLIKDTKSSSPTMTTMNASILSLLNLSEELYIAKEAITSFKKKEEEFEQSADSVKELASAKETLATYEAQIKSMKTRMEKMQIENSELNNMLDEYKDKFNGLRTEYELNKRTLNDLQNKFLENQIELVKARKTLLDFNE